MPRSRKGKQKATRSVSLSSSSDEDATKQGPSSKRSRLHSPVHVKQVAMAKLASKSGSTSKGLAGLASLVNNAILTAARVETNRGLRSSSSSKVSHGGSGTQFRADKQVFGSVTHSRVHNQNQILVFLGLGCVFCWDNRVLGSWS